jgi:hypothetical protein
MTIISVDDSPLPDKSPGNTRENEDHESDDITHLAASAEGTLLYSYRIVILIKFSFPSFEFFSVADNPLPEKSPDNTRKNEDHASEGTFHVTALAGTEGTSYLTMLLQII